MNRLTHSSRLRALGSEFSGICATLLASATLLLPACTRKDPALLDAGLIHAAERGDRAEVERLLTKGARIEARNASGRTVLTLAALKGQTDIVRLLVAKGAEVNATDPNGMTPLMWAAFGGSADVVRLLLEKGADPARKDQNGENAFDWARPNIKRILSPIRTQKPSR